VGLRWAGLPPAREGIRARGLTPPVGHPMELQAAKPSESLWLYKRSLRAKNLYRTFTPVLNTPCRGGVTLG
jgi:hypothetical protein